jgi:hypothetical protein
MTIDGRTDAWREGKWVDLWSVVHFFSGLSIGFAVYLFHFGTLASTLLVLVSLTAYEMWEVIVEIEEAPTNRFTDVVFGMLGFLLIFIFVAPLLATNMFILLFGLVLTTNVVMSIAGWHASQKAEALKKRLRARLLRERKKFGRTNRL